MNDRTGQTRSRAALALAACCVAGSAAALPPPAPCVWNEGAGRLEPVVDGVYAPGLQEVFPAAAGDGFVTWVLYGGTGDGYGPERFVLQHCPTGQDLLIVLPEGDVTRLEAAYDEMIRGEAPYTMRQIGEAMAQLGAGVRRVQNEFGSCGCDVIWGNG
ncbi:hypothetical protein [Roseicyclus persicicus]|uniref:Uncharacterized protein n=1 Tax=Roseicyclus persicicus TaxID=2650661 RepID=A0A7X6JZ23_9RHOB|nr:hypothetical protein [Roseibacterium persicicum]NKX44353.1 hypothetical protein [Roseibacterium persicicum]